MPLLHCSHCHHEYESYRKDWENDKCDWCGHLPYLIKEKTELELMVDNTDMLIEILKKIK